mmetsp:Transcript_40476/g.86905  ORF Transcript_40476/g.86905 Transcript_40476/m.86905 type:complete len:208 (-) Transcript_40476:255-878(-)
MQQQMQVQQQQQQHRFGDATRTMAAMSPPPPPAAQMATSNGQNAFGLMDNSAVPASHQPPQRTPQLAPGAAGSAANVATATAAGQSSPLERSTSEAWQTCSTSDSPRRRWADIMEDDDDEDGTFNADDFVSDCRAKPEADKVEVKGSLKPPGSFVAPKLNSYQQDTPTLPVLLSGPSDIFACVANAPRPKYAPPAAPAPMAGQVPPY